MNSEPMNKNTWPIIVGGVHRSGTSLVRRILDSHSRIHCGPEIKFFKDWHGDYIGDPIKHARFFESARAVLPADLLMQIFGKGFVELHQRAAGQANKPRWADKNPENVLYLDEWEKILGREWVFIQVVRNPLDTLASIAEANFRFAIPQDLDGRIRLYKYYSEAGLSYFRANPERSFRVIYEALVTSPWREIQRMMEWLEEQAEFSQLAFNSIEHQPGLEDPKIAGTVEIQSDSLGRWKRAFSPEEVRVIVNGTQSLWAQLDTEGIYRIDDIPESR